MKTLIQTVLVALIFGGLSAGGSFYWLKLNGKKPPTEAVAKTAKAEDEPKTSEDDESMETSDSQDASSSATLAADQTGAKIEAKPAPFSFGPPVAARPPYTPNADEAGDLIYKLRVRLASTTRQERRVAEREDAMKLIADDLNAELAKAAKLKKQLSEEQSQTIKSLGEARRAFDNEREMLYEDLAKATRHNEERLQEAIREKDEAIKQAEDALKAAREEQDDLRKQLDDVRQPAKRKDQSGSPDQTVNLKKTAEMMDSMPPEDTATLLIETVNEGRTESVVAILNAMKPRVCAKVIPVIKESDPELAADLIARLNRLKKATTTPTAPAPGL